ncbi:MAG: VacJ family lipoprotein [Deltaproteobacteria bacterium CG_4_10_14_3_um_filter_60_8]|nr:MAG: VacJ family lipoprotein [Deltaproteobacteria bacterium CG_4_10_14_3_um_filter_60_8]
MILRLGRVIPCAVLLAVACWLVTACAVSRSDQETLSLDREWVAEEDALLVEPVVYDPLESINRKFFLFNDRLYFWAFNPTAKAYAAVVPKDVRSAFSHAVGNLIFPVRFCNCLLQGKVRQAGVELGRFSVNTTLGLVGLTDPAADVFGLPPPPAEDLGQSMGVYGVGSGVYLCLPFYGPANLRDAAGLFGDYLITPAFYLTAGNFEAGASYYLTDLVNNLSLNLGEYEKFKEESFDPYVAMRNAYQQNRANEIRDAVSANY